MAFIFSTSHLPETRVRRPDHLEDDEEDEDVMQPMPRAGGVRAFSHLPVRDNPAPSTAPLRDDSPRGGIAPIPPRSATPVGRPRPYVDPEEDIETDHDLGTSHAPEPDSDHDDNNAPRSHDYQDDSPWYMPRITAQDLPPQAHDEEAGRSSLNRPVRDSGFDDAHSAERSTSTTRDNGFSPSPQDLRDDFHAPAPDSPTREAPAQNISPALPRGRIFEKRLPPGLRSQGTGQFQSLADKPEYHDLVYRPRSVEHERHQADGFFQNVAAPLESRQNQSSPQTPQTISQSAVPQSPSINGQTPKRQLTRAELELISPDGKLMHPVGQLGITALNTIRDPNKTASGKKPKTVCLYDGQEIRTKDAQHYEADAAALHQAAATYASNASWMIDISNPNWQQQLEQIRDAEERNGSGIDRIMIFDHGDSTGQEFGATRLDPYSPEWQAITSCIRTGGDIVLMGCEVAKKDANGNGPDYLYELYRNSNGKRRPKIHAYDGRVRHRENKLQHSVTEGEEHTIPLD